MEAVRIESGSVATPDTRVILRDSLRKQIHRTVISVDGDLHRLKLVGARAADRNRRTVLITVTTDNTSDCAHVQLTRDRLDDADFVAALLAHAMRAVLTGELPPDGVEAF